MRRGSTLSDLNWKFLVMRVNFSLLPAGPAVKVSRTLERGRHLWLERRGKTFTLTFNKIWYLSAREAVIENGCTDQLSDFKPRPFFFGWCGCWSRRDRIPTTTASENTLRLACSFVITLFEGTKQRVTHVYIFFLCWQKNVFPDSTKSCGPYKPRRAETTFNSSRHANRGSHDTIGRIHLLFNQESFGFHSSSGGWFFSSQFVYWLFILMNRHS